MCEVIEKNRAEARADGMVEVAIEMLKEKMSIEMIARFTKLTVEQVKEIGKKNALNILRVYMAPGYGWEF
ncbi:hypothetical protein [Anaerovibrio sp.]|uniref:hypothetical protein n=1 Tax=Anaerovibrio sp. TaxID=1872532 RepID=UPI0025C1DCF7|nr:hypothetical protein [Anaerovibrio sp.]MBR2142361.1 hypothetical protein [Anaerovibrio sp.]